MKHLFYSVLIIFVFTACNTGNSSKKSDGQTTKSQEFISILKARTGQGIMLGHQDALAYGSMWYGDAGRSDVKSVCGDYPAVIGWDLGNIELGSSLNVDSVEFKKIKEYIQITNDMGGVSTISWTASNPVREQTEQNPVSLILTNKHYKDLYLSYLDQLATFFINLKDKNNNPIPVIFRPFYNPNTTTHWWSTSHCSAEEYRKLWRLTADYLRKEKNVENLVWTFSLYDPSTLEEIQALYPGDEYVDIIGSSLYLEQDKDPDGKIYTKELNRSLALITELSNKRHKIAALTDTGMEGIKIPNYFSGLIYPIVSRYPISYILFGKNAWNIENHYHIPIPGHPASEDFFKFAKSPRILTCNKLNQ